MPELKTLTRAQGVNQALITRELEPAGWRLNFADEPVLIDGFRKMVRNDEYDVAELAVTTYLTAKEHGAKFTALPLFIVRDVHHHKTQVLADGSIKTAADLAGKRVGVNRGYTVTAGVWARAALADVGLDLSSVTWVRSGGEHVATYEPPANVVSAPEGSTLEQLLLAGEIDAVVNADIQHDAVTSLLPADASWESLKETGFVPVNHLVVVRDELLEANPGLATALFDVFGLAKDHYLTRLDAGLAETQQDRNFQRFRQVSGQRDPLPYGVDANRGVLEKLVSNAVSQGVLTKPLEIDMLFAAEVRGAEA